MEKKKKKSTFDINKYKTHDGPHGSPEMWIDMARQAFMIRNPNATKLELETYIDKITKNKRKIIME